MEGYCGIMFTEEDRRCMRILGIEGVEECKIDEGYVRRAFRRASRKYHPDSRGYESGRVTFIELVYSRDRLLMALTDRSGLEEMAGGDAGVYSWWRERLMYTTGEAFRRLMDVHMMSDRGTHRYYMRLGRIFGMEEEVRQIIGRYYERTMRVYKISCGIDSYFEGELYVWSDVDGGVVLYVPLWQQESYFEEENILFTLRLREISEEDWVHYLYGDECIYNLVCGLRYEIDSCSNEVDIYISIRGGKRRSDGECKGRGLGIRVGANFDVWLEDIYSWVGRGPMKVEGVGPYTLDEESDTYGYSGSIDESMGRSSVRVHIRAHVDD